MSDENQSVSDDLVPDFYVSSVQLLKLHNWTEEQDAKVVAMQREQLKTAEGTMTPFQKDSLNNGVPYYGASGGAYTWKITSTSLGSSIVVVNNVTKEEIDLTEYDAW